MDEIDQVIHIDWELVSLHKQCMNRLMSDRGVYPGQPPLLFTLGRMGACNQADLAKALHISPATIAVSLKRMENPDSSSGYPTGRPAFQPHRTHRKGPQGRGERGPRPSAGSTSRCTGTSPPRNFPRSCIFTSGCSKI